MDTFLYGFFVRFRRSERVTYLVLLDRLENLSPYDTFSFAREK